jgi:hypothetical protein
MTEQQQARILRRLEILQRQVEREMRVLVALRGRYAPTWIGDDLQRIAKMVRDIKSDR